MVVNLLFEQDINCKTVSYEVITKLGATAGMKRKRAAAIGDEDGDEYLQEHPKGSPENIEK